MNRDGDYIVQRAKWLEEHDKKMMKRFAHELKETFNNKFPRDYPSTKPYFTLEEVRRLVDLELELISI